MGVLVGHIVNSASHRIVKRLKQDHTVQAGKFNKLHVPYSLGWIVYKRSNINLFLRAKTLEAPKTCFIELHNNISTKCILLLRYILVHFTSKTLLSTSFQNKNTRGAYKLDCLGGRYNYK